MVPWCSGQTCGPVKAEIAGSNPVGTASEDIPAWDVFCLNFTVSSTKSMQTINGKLQSHKETIKYLYAFSHYFCAKKQKPSKARLPKKGRLTALSRQGILFLLQ